MSDDGMYIRAYFEIQKILDEVLGSDVEDSAGAGIVADVWLAVEKARQTGRETAAVAIEDMPHDLGDEGWRALEAKAVEANYPAEWVRRRRTRDEFTAATIEAAYQYGYRRAAQVARNSGTR